MDIIAAFSKEAQRLYGIVESLQRDIQDIYDEFNVFLNTHPMNEILLATKTVHTHPMHDLRRSFNPASNEYDGRYLTPQEVRKHLNLYQAARLCQVILFKKITRYTFKYTADVTTKPFSISRSFLDIHRPSCTMQERWLAKQSFEKSIAFNGYHSSRCENITQMFRGRL